MIGFGTAKHFLMLWQQLSLLDKRVDNPWLDPWKNQPCLDIYVGWQYHHRQQ